VSHLDRLFGTSQMNEFVKGTGS